MTRLRFRDVAAVRPSSVPERSVVTVLRVPPEMAGMRLDLFVRSQLKRTSRTRAQAIVERSAFSAEGHPLRRSDRVRAEQHVLLWREPWDEAPVPTELPLLYEDEHFFAVAKPPGLPVHPSARYHRNTVVKLLELTRPDAFFTLAHRLDRETSGVLLLAKSREADRRIKRQLQLRDGFEKRYVAITWGAPAQERLRVDLPLELDPVSRLRVRMRVARPGTGLASATRFEVLAMAHARGREYAMLGCELETGRQHQIRVHLAAMGIPIVGDKLYGPDPEMFARCADGVLTAEDLLHLELDRHALHAAHLAFTHPFTGERVAIDAPLARDMSDFWATLQDATACANGWGPSEAPASQGPEPRQST